MTTYRTYTVQGRAYLVFSDFITRATYAQDLRTLSTRRIHSNGYITNDLTVRKAIARAYGLESFRK